METQHVLCFMYLLIFVGHELSKSSEDLSGGDLASTKHRRVKSDTRDQAMCVASHLVSLFLFLFLCLFVFVFVFLSVSVHCDFLTLSLSLYLSLALSLSLFFFLSFPFCFFLWTFLFVLLLYMFPPIFSVFDNPPSLVRGRLSALFFLLGFLGGCMW